MTPRVNVETRATINVCVKLDMTPTQPISGNGNDVEYFQIALTSIQNLTSFADFVVLEVKKIRIYQNNLHRSDLTFSGVLRGTQGSHVEMCLNL